MGAECGGGLFFSPFPSFPSYLFRPALPASDSAVGLDGFLRVDSGGVLFCAPYGSPAALLPDPGAVRGQFVRSGSTVREEEAVVVADRGVVTRP